MELVLYFLLSVFVLQFVIILIVGIIYRSSANFAVHQPFMDGASVVIPFKNEERRIQGLLVSIDGLEDTEFPIEFIFVNDHSNENEVVDIQKLKKPFRILDNTGNGKKEAIRTGVLSATYSTILTWDADIAVKAGYFNELIKLVKKDMWVLPVKMKGCNMIGRLGAIDYNWLQMLGYAVGVKAKPFMASGANLMFNRDAFLAVDGKRNDYHLPSGDDMFLLEAFKKEGYPIGVSNGAELTVTTDSPKNMRDLVKQRSRWAKKMNHTWTKPSICATVFLGIVEIAFIGCFVGSFIYHDVLFLMPLVIKYLAEYLFMRFYKGSKGAAIDLLTILIHQFFFPGYLLLVSLNKGKEERWT